MDGGDAYTLASIGVLPSNKTISGVITLQSNPIPNTSLVIRLVKLADESKTYDYQSPDGTNIRRPQSESQAAQKKVCQSRLRILTKALASRRGSLMETTCSKAVLFLSSA